MKAKKIILTGLAGLIIGCGITNRELVPAINFGVPREENYKASFFVGKEWYDRNKNNSMDKSDGYYNPEVFKGKEPIVVIAEIEGYNGNLTTKIWNSKTGNVVKTARREIHGKTLIQYNFTAEDIMKNQFGGDGNYNVAWYIGEGVDSERIEERGFKIKNE
ncbi:hypothetical protein HYT23_00205 [Candidatus Pacearchaeota archaeon]|nr:hypothetical protein [Candidatus Pacearchaeota archaeon]